MTIQEVAKEFWKEYKSKYNEINACGVGNDHIQVRLSEDPNNIIKDLPKNYLGFPVNYKVIGIIRPL